MSSSFDLIIKNGKCFIDGQLKQVDIAISNGSNKRNWQYRSRKSKSLRC